MSSISSNYRHKPVKVRTAKRRNSSSNRWLKRQLNDPYVVKAKIDGYRSRAAYKLLEINERFKLLKSGMKIVDLGAAPGGWSQVAAKIVRSDEQGAYNKVIAIDLLDIEEIPGVVFIKKDFFDDDAIEVITNATQGEADVVISDMAANTTGHSATDHIRIMCLCERALDLALTILRPGGHFIAKIFRGGTEKDLLNKVKLNFNVVKHFKPSASRKESSEFYLIALNRKDYK
jgi:23S rRNA (uridine2552-2'-O)-methyltransferase